MTKEITKANIIQEIQDKFKLRELTPAKFTFSEEVIPTYNVGPHLENWRSTYTTKAITTSGGRQMYIIPSGERWALRAYSTIFVSGVYTIAGIYIRRYTRKDTNDFSYLDLTAAQSTSYLVTLPEAVILEPKDELYVNVDGFTSAGDLTLHMDHRRELLR